MIECKQKQTDAFNLKNENVNVTNAEFFFSNILRFGKMRITKDDGFGHRSKLHR